MNVFMVFSWDDEGEIFLYMSTDLYCAEQYARDFFERTQYHTWIEENEIDLLNFEPYEYCNYIPDSDNIVWEKKTPE